MIIARADRTPIDHAPERRTVADRWRAGFAVFFFGWVIGCTSASEPNLLVMFGNPEFLVPAEHLTKQAESTMDNVGLLDLNHLDSDRFYRDTRLGGDDDDRRLGLESATLAFYIGHGFPSEFSAYRDKQVYLDEVQFGDGSLRYLWLLSCQTMAHGPHPFDKPNDFDPAMSQESENVFRRWGGYYLHPSEVTTPLSSKLRMACGGSTKLKTPTVAEIIHLWENLVTGTPPSDAFIASTSANPIVSLCISRGGGSPDKTPLYDTTLTNEPNAEGLSRYLYIQYPVFPNLAQDKLTSDLLSLINSGHVPSGEEVASTYPQPPSQAPILELEPLPVPANLVTAFLNNGSVQELGFRSLQLPRVLTELGIDAPASSTGFRAYYQPCSGKLAVRGPAAPPEELEGLPAPEQVAVAGLGPDDLKVLAWLAVGELVPTSFEVTDMYIDRVPPEVAAGNGSRDLIKRYFKSRIVEVSLGVRAGGDIYPVIGNERGLSLEVGGEGTPIAGSVAARRVSGCRGGPSCPKVPVLSKEEAQLEAEQVASESGVRYESPPGYQWGYLEAPASCHQREMGIVHRFTFEPVEEEDALVLVVDVRGHEDIEEPLCYGFGEAADSRRLPAGCDPGGP